MLSTSCVARVKLTEALFQFQPGQLEAVAHGKDAFVRMPTGGGKSLCMFLLPIQLCHVCCGEIISVFDGVLQSKQYYLTLLCGFVDSPVIY